MRSRRLRRRAGGAPPAYLYTANQRINSTAAAEHFIQSESEPGEVGGGAQWDPTTTAEYSTEKERKKKSTASVPEADEFTVTRGLIANQ